MRERTSLISKNHGLSARIELRGLLAAAATLLVAGCDSLPIAMGDVHAIVVTASPELWDDVGEAALATLGRTVYTTREENTFRVTYEEPSDTAWAKLRRLRQILLVGKASDPWMATALSELDGLPAPPEILQVREVWGRQQLVTLVVLEEETTPAQDARTVRELLPELSDIFDGQFRDWVRARMFATGPDEELRATLEERHGFSFTVPQVYDYQRVDSLGPQVHIFRNDNPDPSELIRQFTVTWESPMPPSLQPQDLLAWRARLVERYYDYPQVLNDERVSARSLDQHGSPAVEIQAVWENPPDAYPAAGPLRMRAVPCHEQSRVYLIDAWLYAPGRDKYEYMIQIEEILDSFRCLR